MIGPHWVICQTYGAGVRAFVRSAKTYHVGGAGVGGLAFRILIGLKEFQISLAKKKRIASTHLIDTGV